MRRAALAALLLPLLLGLLEAVARGVAKIGGRERGVTFDPDLGWRLRPGIERSGPQWGPRAPAKTNSHGWRDGEHAFEKPGGVRRIVALGDSFTFGIGVDDGERYSEVLERTVERLEVVNLGVNAYGTDQELRALEVWGARYSPDVVLLQVFLGNDLDDIRHERRFSWPRPHFRLVGGELRLVPPERTWDVVVRSGSYLGELLVRGLDQRLGRNRIAAEWRDADPVPLFAALVRRIRDTAEGLGAPLLVLLADTPGRPATGGIAEREGRARDALADLGLPILDTRPLLAAAAASGAVTHGPDSHWSPRGHEVVARAIADELAARRWLR